MKLRAERQGHLKVNNQKSVLRSSILSENKKLLLAMLYLAGGSIKRYSRLQMGVYVLKESNLHSYKFNEQCSWGPADCQFHDDLEEMCGYIEFDLYKSSIDNQQHGEYRLYKPILDKAEQFANEIKRKNYEGFKKLKKISELLGKDPEKITSEFLYKRLILK